MQSRPTSLRFGILPTVLVTVVPVLGLSAYHAASVRRQLQEDRDAGLVRLADQTATSISSYLEAPSCAHRGVAVASVSRRLPGWSILPHHHAPFTSNTEHGHSRIYYFTPVPSMDEGLWVAAGVVESAVAAEARGAFFATFSLTSLLAIALVLLGWWIGERLVLRPIQRLSNAAAALTRGDYPSCRPPRCSMPLATSPPSPCFASKSPSASSSRSSCATRSPRWNRRSTRSRRSAPFCRSAPAAKRSATTKAIGVKSSSTSGNTPAPSSPTASAPLPPPPRSRIRRLAGAPPRPTSRLNEEHVN